MLSHNHYLLLHISTKNEIEDVKRNAEESSPAESNLSVNSATTENKRGALYCSRGFSTYSDC